MPGTTTAKQTGHSNSTWEQDPKQNCWFVRRKELKYCRNVIRTGWTTRYKHGVERDSRNDTHARRRFTGKGPGNQAWRYIHRRECRCSGEKINSLDTRRSNKNLSLYFVYVATSQRKLFKMSFFWLLVRFIHVQVFCTVSRFWEIP